MKFDIGMYFL